MIITNLRSYIGKRIKKWNGPDNYLLWLYLEPSLLEMAAYRIVGHAYFQNDMFWDGSGINPIKIVPGTKDEMIEAVMEEIALRGVEDEL